MLVNASLRLSPGDVLSDRGRVFRTHGELLAQFHPAITNHDYGLDALPVRPGDLVSSLVLSAWTWPTLDETWLPDTCRGGGS